MMVQFPIIFLLLLLVGKKVELIHLQCPSRKHQRGETGRVQNASAHTAGSVVRCLLVIIIK